jgi:hypothetical protein
MCLASVGQNIIVHSKNNYSTFSFPLGSKPALSFPMLIIWRVGKLLYFWTDVDEAKYIASFGQNIIVHAKKTHFVFLMAANLHNLFPCLFYGK